MPADRQTELDALVEKAATDAEVAYADAERVLVKAGVPELLDARDRLREALALRVPAEPPQWQRGGQQTVWIWDEEDRAHRALLGDVEPRGGSVPSQRDVAASSNIDNEGKAEHGE